MEMRVMKKSGVEFIKEILIDEKTQQQQMWYDNLSESDKLLKDSMDRIARFADEFVDIKYENYQLRQKLIDTQEESNELER